ncbi:MAG: xylulokinase [Patescibacteria group bacterium]
MDVAPLLLAVDLGTTACKAAVFTRDGRILTLAYREYPLLRISRAEIEQDAEAWWRLVREVGAEALGGLADGQRQKVKALGLSVQGISFVPVDEGGAPLCNALTWLDFRAADEAGELGRVFGARDIFALTGLLPNPIYTLPKIIWLRRHRPEIFSRARRFCTAQDFVLARLAGRYVTDHSVAGGTLMHEVRALRWSEALLGRVPLAPDRLPEIDWAGTAVGPLDARVAAEIGAPRDLTVVLGAHDQECAGLGAGLRPGEATVSLGTASIILASAAAPVLDPGLRIPCLPSAERDRWVLEAPVSVGGAGLRWLRDNLNLLPAMWRGRDGEPLDYEGVVALAEKAAPGAAGVSFFPHLAGATSPFWAPDASGVFHGISLASSAFDLLRAALEGWIFQIRTNLDVVEELAGRVERVIAFAGAARNRFITQLLADVLGKPVAISETPETALLGAAILAGVGAGVYRDVPSAQAEAVRTAGIVYPRAAMHGAYEEIYRRYRRIEAQVLAMNPD